MAPLAPPPRTLTAGEHLRASTRSIRLAEARRRSALFNGDFSGIGAMLATIRGSRIAIEHPHRCRCQGDETDPHRHYPEAPFSCARCGHKNCGGYSPALPDEEMT